MSVNNLPKVATM